MEVAGKRETRGYGEIARKLEYTRARPIFQMLGGIMWYCIDSGLPPLTVVVVNKRTGLPGDGLKLQGSVASETTPVWNHDWYRERIPSIADYVAANAKHK